MNKKQRKQQEEKPYLEGTNSCDDFEWEDLCEDLTNLMDEVNPSQQWYGEMKDFGWQHDSGYQTFSARNGRQLLQVILPNTACSFRIYRHGKHGIKINNCHHDSPMWGVEWYYLSRASDHQEEEAA